ncbi:alpha mannosidase-like protein, partial [Rhizophlyctis rosea]
MRRDKAKEMFDHGYQHYMKYAFPLDELNPISCDGRTKDLQNPDNWNINDVLGNFSLTLVDSLDSHAILNDRPAFEEAVRLTIQHVNFNLDSRVQVFEVTIRMLGGLLSGHLLASEEEFGFKLPWYKGELLDLARDLGDRLLPAFDTGTRMPLPRVNLRTGVLPWETNSTCAAGAGTLLLEFGVLSRLTGDPKFEALKVVWAHRSDLNLVGNTMDVQTGKWISTMAGIGAGIDSFYEYQLKSYILFGDHTFATDFAEAYQAILKHVRDVDGHIYKQVDMNNGGLMATWIDSLAAFFPGLQVLAGDLPSAIRHHQVYWTVWRRYGGMPERFDFKSKGIAIAGYPLRPEFVESTYMLYQATKNPFYLEVGERILEDLERTARVDCGFATIGSVETGKHEDRMESFFLSETLKYLYLLFDQDNFINKLDSNFVFTTEGHFLPLPRRFLTKPKPPSASKSTSPPIDTCQNFQQQHFPSIWPAETGPLLSKEEVRAIDRLVAFENLEEVDG